MSAALSTSYLGLSLTSPIVASAGPLTGEVATVECLAAAGAGAIVMPSLFEEEILSEELQLNRCLDAGADLFAEALNYFRLPDNEVPALVADRYLARLSALKAAVDVPVIASLNATSAGGWTRFAGLLTEAGADAIELNLYVVAADPTRSGSDVEDDLLHVVTAVRDAASVPIAVKLSPYLSSPAHFANRLVQAGADGLVLFNRFYQPDVDLDELDVVSRLDLSSAWELRLPLRWIAILRPLLPMTSLAATSGVTSGTDVAKAVAVGADVAMTTSAVLRHGPEQIGVLLAELREWLDRHEYESVGQLRGCMSHANTANPAAFERANYLKMLHSWSPGTLG